MSYYNYLDELQREAKADAKRMNKTGKLTANAWRFNDCGSREMMCASMDSIFAAYEDSKATNNCW